MILLSADALWGSQGTAQPELEEWIPGDMKLVQVSGKEGIAI